MDKAARVRPREEERRGPHTTGRNRGKRRKGEKEANARKNDTGQGRKGGTRKRRNDAAYKARRRGLSNELTHQINPMAIDDPAARRGGSNEQELARDVSYLTSAGRRQSKNGNQLHRRGTQTR